MAGIGLLWTSEHLHQLPVLFLGQRTALCLSWRGLFGTGAPVRHQESVTQHRPRDEVASNAHC